MNDLTPKRIPVAVLGATGSVGQRFLCLLDEHPWFEIASLAASPRNVGKTYAEAVHWTQSESIPKRLASMRLSAAEPTIEGRVIFSALDAEIAGPIELAFAKDGRLVVSNAKSHRMHAAVPLLVPEVNPGHLDLLDAQGAALDLPAGGGIVTNPNCSTIGLVLALAPLVRSFGVKRVSVVTMQALSGAGMPGVPALQMVDNLVPYIDGEEEKLASEPTKIFGTLIGGEIELAPITVSAQCNRVAVIDGHTECIGVELGRAVEADEILAAWRDFRSAPQDLGLPSAPARPTLYLKDPSAPQPRRHRDLEGGMATILGRLRPCPILGWQFVALSHNTLRGAAGGALLCAELVAARRGWKLPPV